MVGCTGVSSSLTGRFIARSLCSLSDAILPARNLPREGAEAAAISVQIAGAAGFFVGTDGRLGGRSEIVISRLDAQGIEAATAGGNNCSQVAGVHPAAPVPGAIAVADLVAGGLHDGDQRTVGGHCLAIGMVCQWA